MCEDGTARDLYKPLLTERRAPPPPRKRTAVVIIGLVALCTAAVLVLITHLYSVGRCYASLYPYDDYLDIDRICNPCLYTFKQRIRKWVVANPAFWGGIL